MDIVCAKCGKHFNSVEAAREHSRTCSVRASNEPAYTKSSNNSVLSPKELEKLIAIKQKHSNENGKDVNNSPTNSNTSNEPPKKTPNRHIKAHKSIPNWLLVLLVLFAGSFLVWGISVAIRTFMPLWLVFGFFFIYFVENFLIVALSKFSKLLLNLSLLSIIGLIIWTGIRLYSGEFLPNSIIGSIVFITELILFFWTCKIIVNNKRRQPSMKLTVFSLVILFLILAFAGVKPLSDYKNTALQNISEWWDSTVINAKNDNTDNNIEDISLVNIPTSTLTTQTTTQSFIEKFPDKIGEFISPSTELSDYVTRFNEYRKSQGCAPLTFTEDLNRIAALRLIEIQEYFSHYSKGNYGQHLGENIVMGIYSNQAALECWQESPGHNANMLDRSYKYTGYAIGGGYAVQVFSEYETINGEPQLPPGWYWVD